MQWAKKAGQSYNGQRDIFKTLGYPEVLLPEHFRGRFDRNGIANRIIKIIPNATWSGGAEIVEDEDPTKVTPFEAAFDALNDRLKIWNILKRADILAGLGRFSVVVLGAPGEMDQPLTRCAPDDLKYLMPYGETDAKVEQWIKDKADPRFGKPEFYGINFNRIDGRSSQGTTSRVHYTRVFHVADELLDDNTYAEPRLQAVWNFLNDLDKVVGGGSEAFWKRADRGTQFDLDPEMELPGETPDQQTTTALAAMKEQIEKYEHGLTRYLTTRGVKINEMGSDVADFSSPGNFLISMISATTGIPQRVFMGSEQGKLAAKMDRLNWDDRIADRRESSTAPMVLRPFVDQLISLGVMPPPQSGHYDARWPSNRIMDEEQRAIIAGQWAGLNSAAGTVVVTGDEIRDRLLGLAPLTEAQKAGAMPKEPKVARKFLRKWLVLSEAQQRQFRAAWNPEQPRDEDGKFTDGGPGPRFHLPGDWTRVEQPGDKMHGRLVRVESAETSRGFHQTSDFRGTAVGSYHRSRLIPVSLKRRRKNAGGQSAPAAVGRFRRAYP